MEILIRFLRYTTGSGKNSHTWLQTVIYFHSPQLDVPQFALRPEHVFHKIGAVFGYQDIDFANHPEFSSAYLLQGNNEKKIREVFRDEVLKLFESKRNMSVEADGGRLICYRSRQTIPPANVRSFMEEGFQLYALFRDTPRV